METERLPWLFAILTAGWFGWMAHRAGRSWALWAVGGAIFGLVASTIVIGLGNAVSLPYSEHERTVHRLKWTAAAAALIVVVGWMLTSSLHRMHVSIWRRIKSQPAATPTAPTSESKTTTPAQTKTPGRV
jgi:hypothetical protein